MNQKDKIGFGLHICDHCASERQLKLEIFQLKQGRVRNSQPCMFCQAQTKVVFKGTADSEKELDLIKSNLKEE